MRGPRGPLATSPCRRRRAARSPRSRRGTWPGNFGVLATGLGRRHVRDGSRRGQSVQRDDIRMLHREARDRRVVWFVRHDVLPSPIPPTGPRARTADLRRWRSTGVRPLRAFTPVGGGAASRLGGLALRGCRSSGAVAAVQFANAASDSEPFRRRLPCTSSSSRLDEDWRRSGCVSRWAGTGGTDADRSGRTPTTGSSGVDGSASSTGRRRNGLVAE